MNDLWAIAEIQVIPLGVGVSVRSWVERAVKLIDARGFTYETHGYGTNVEGPIDALMDLVAEIHRDLHGAEVPRVSTVVKIGTRIDKDVRLAEKSIRLRST